MRPEFAACFLLVLLVTVAESGEQKIDAKLESSRLEKMFGIVLKSATLAGANNSHLKMVLEFTRDIEPADVARMRQAFGGFGTITPPTLIHCCLFDEENVIIRQTTVKNADIIEGELTGIKGDAFRVAVSIPRDLFARTKKIEIRSVEYPIPKN